MDSDKEQLIERFLSVTGSSRYLAEQYLTRNKDDLMNAIEDFYATNGSGDPGPAPASHAAPGGIRTLRDLNEGNEDDKKTTNNFFTGGEKSGLQVEDPNKKKDSRSIIEDIFQTAREQMEQPDDRTSAGQSETPEPKFTGYGFKLGDGEAPSERIADPDASKPQKPSKVNREIIFWRQGFTIADGPLHRYDDPSNQFLLQELNQGRVPISLLNVEFGQDVDVSVIRKTEEDYNPPKSKAGGFTGSGHRLGSPVPGESIPVVPEPTPEPKEAPKKEPEGEGDTLVQIRFANGKRSAHKFNSSDSIAVVYDFVKNHEYSTPSKSFILSHAFPVKPIENTPDVTVATAGLKNAVIVQRWA